MLAGALIAPVLWRQTAVYDYTVHREIARQMADTLTLRTPHFLYQLLVIPFYRLLLPENLPLAGLVPVLLAWLATAILIFRVQCRAWDSAAGAFTATAGLLVAGPVTLLAPLDGHLYLGYLAPNVVHNPTMLILRPFAILSFGYAVAAFGTGPAAGGRTMLAAALVTVLGALAKPSHLICLIPALAVMTGLSRWQRTPANDRLLWGGFFFPAAAVLAGQYWLTYSTAQLAGVYAGESRIVFAPLLVMGTYSDWLPAKFLLSLLFPLAVAAGDFREARRDPRLRLAWLTFLFGTAWTYLLAESGPRLLQGNFTWSGQIALYVLFIASAAFLGERSGTRHGALARGHWWRRACIALLLAHAACGMVFFGAEFLHSEQYW